MNDKEFKERLKELSSRELTESEKEYIRGIDSEIETEEKLIADAKNRIAVMRKTTIDRFGYQHEPSEADWTEIRELKRSITPHEQRIVILKKDREKYDDTYRRLSAAVANARQTVQYVEHELESVNQSAEEARNGTDFEAIEKAEKEVFAKRKALAEAQKTRLYAETELNGYIPASEIKADKLRGEINEDARQGDKLIEKAIIIFKTASERHSEIDELTGNHIPLIGFETDATRYANTVNELKSILNK